MPMRAREHWRIFRKRKSMVRSGDYRPLDLRAALMIWSICFAPMRFVPLSLDACPTICRTSGSGIARRR